MTGRLSLRKAARWCHFPLGLRPRRVPLAVVLGATIGVLVALSVVSVLSIGWLTASTNTEDLLRQRFTLMLSALEGRVRGELDPALQQTSSLSRLLISGAIDAGDPRAVQHLLLGAIATTPQVQRLVLVGPDMREVGAERHDQTITPVDKPAGPGLAAQYEAVFAAGRDTASWAAPTYLGPRLGSAFVLRQPISDHGRRLGVLLSSVSVGELSEFVRSLDDRASGTHSFVLYGPDRMLAQGAMPNDQRNRSSVHPLPRRDELGDPVLAAAWLPVANPIVNRSSLDVRMATADGSDWLVLLKSIHGYGPEDLIAGLYMPSSAIGHELRRLRWSVFAGLGVLLLSLVAAGLLARRIAGPITKVAVHATAIGRFDLRSLAPLPRSRIRELDAQGRAFNAMEVSLRWFAAYVPRSLVQYLITRGDPAGVATAEQTITVMFTDIVGFTAQAERLSAGDAASFLNRHFSVLTACIEAEGGTVDKFIGDAVMAFWNAPGRQDDHADRACRAALAIRAAIGAENDARAARGDPRTRLRIGIHTGRAVVGNIGSAERVNYTAVGDTVNVAQRLEAIAGTLAPSASEVTIVVSDAVRAALSDPVPMTQAGALAMKGRAGHTDAYRIA